MITWSSKYLRREPPAKSWKKLSPGFTQTMCSARSYAASRPAKLPNCAKSWKARRKSRIGSELLNSLPETRVLVLVADQMALHPDRRQLRPHAADTAGADARPADLA